MTIDDKNQYFQMIRTTWGKQLKAVFEGIDDPVWNASPEMTANVLSTTAAFSQPVRVAPPEKLADSAGEPAPLQTLAQQSGSHKQH